MPCRVCKEVHTNPMSSNICNACGVEARKKRVVDTKAAYTAAYVDADTKAAYVTAETKAALAAYKAAYDAYEDAEAAYVKAVDELKEYKEQDNE
jgi:hypothetical protein